MPFSVRFALDFVYPTVSRFFREEKSIMGHRTSIKNPRLTKRLPLEEAETVFLNHCRIKNLSPRTIQYYQEDLEYFFAHLEGIRYADEITREVFEDFLIKQVDAGKKTTSLNTRIRGLRVFFKFCAEREYMELFPVKLMKEDDTVKEPYTDAEIARLLQKPKTNRWVEWRNWALVHYFVAAGNRASTVVNLRVKDIDFEKMTIFPCESEKPEATVCPPLRIAEGCSARISPNVGGNAGRFSLRLFQREAALRPNSSVRHQGLQCRAGRFKKFYPSVPALLRQSLCPQRWRDDSTSSVDGTFYDGNVPPLC